MKNMLLIAGITTVLMATFLVWMDKLLTDSLEQFHLPEKSAPALQQNVPGNPLKVYPMTKDSNRLPTPVIAGSAGRCSGV